MPSVQENRQAWGRTYTWPSQGDEWSAVWGGVETHWYATILPRIRQFVPTGTVLEIAPGYGRWSGYLINLSDRYIGIDLAPECIEACVKRFQDAKHARFLVNDGKSLSGVEDDSVDFAFSFDSLVHAEIETIAAYLHELSRKLRPDGVAFIHHSNLGAHSQAALRLSKHLARYARVSPSIERWLRRSRLIAWDHWRAPSVTPQKVADAASGAGLACIGQEVIDWGHESRKMIDCLSVLTLPGSRWERPNQIVYNRFFMAEAFSAAAIAKVYTSMRPNSEEALTSLTSKVDEDKFQGVSR